MTIILSQFFDQEFDQDFWNQPKIEPQVSKELVNLNHGWLNQNAIIP